MSDDTNVIGDDQIPYKESTWGKKVDGEDVIDGYNFKGRQHFKTTREKLENSRLGVDSSGIALVKLYGPNKKKENTVTVTKSKESDIKFVTILAQKIIKPLIDKILNVGGTENILSKSESIKSKKMFACKFCEREFSSNSGLKTHITRIHKVDVEKYQNRTNLDIETMRTDEDESENEELEMVLNDIKREKKYSGKCRQCDTRIEASRKYGLIQHFLKHKEICKVKTKTCTDCKYEANNALSLKRHMRDKHDVMSLSTSPPPKKPKVGDIKNTNNFVEDMDVDEGNASDENILENVNMNIESTEIRSIRMDEKIKAKEKKIEEEERKQKQRFLEKEKEEKMRQENLKLENRKRKQKIKDEKKRSKRKNSNTKNDDEPGSDIPNVKPIPKNITHLVGNGHKIYMVPGDGACGPSSASAFLFKDEVFGPKLRRNMNKFMANIGGENINIRPNVQMATLL